MRICLVCILAVLVLASLMLVSHDGSSSSGLNISVEVLVLEYVKLLIENDQLDENKTALLGEIKATLQDEPSQIKLGQMKQVLEDGLGVKHSYDKLVDEDGVLDPEKTPEHNLARLLVYFATQDKPKEELGKLGKALKEFKEGKTEEIQTFPWPFCIFFGCE